MKPPNPIVDRIFRLLLWGCVLVILGSGMAWWVFDWEDAWLVMFGAGALANLPLFHFAMHRPYRTKSDSDQ